MEKNWKDVAFDYALKEVGEYIVKNIADNYQDDVGIFGSYYDKHVYKLVSEFGYEYVDMYFSNLKITRELRKTLHEELSKKGSEVVSDMEVDF